MGRFRLDARPDFKRSDCLGDAALRVVFCLNAQPAGSDCDPHSLNQSGCDAIMLEKIGRPGCGSISGLAGRMHEPAHQIISAYSRGRVSGWQAKDGSGQRNADAPI
jgi:hypothetical protein